MLGDNTKVILIAPDGFNDFVDPDGRGSAAEGMYVTIGGQDPNKLIERAGPSLRRGLQEGSTTSTARRLHRLRGRRRSWCSRTRSRSADGSRRRIIAESCTTRTSRTASSARSRSTRPATRRSAASRSTRSRAASDHAARGRPAAGIAGGQGARLGSSDNEAGATWERARRRRHREKPVLALVPRLRGQIAERDRRRTPRWSSSAVGDHQPRSRTGSSSRSSS